RVRSEAGERRPNAHRRYGAAEPYGRRPRRALRREGRRPGRRDAGRPVIDRRKERAVRLDLVILAIIQARMSSTPLPGKGMRALVGEPMLSRQLERVRRAERLDRVAVATSTGVDDDVIQVLCRDERTACFRGSLVDVLDRYRQASLAFGPVDHVVRLTGDC